MIKIYKIVILTVVLYRCETWSHTEGGTLATCLRDKDAEQDTCA